MFVNQYASMGSSEVAVKYALKTLIEANETVTRDRVAEIAQCTPRTVSRVFQVMRARGVLVTEGNPHNGYKYHLKPD
jgi:CRP-like cAMP-binding protein